MARASLSGAGERWRDAWRDRGFRYRLVLSVLALAVVLECFARFLGWVETRPGITLPDPILSLFSPVDFSWTTFAVIYGSLVAGIVLLARHPRRLLLAIQAYLLMLITRAAAMALTPLDPPPAMILLRDPFVEFFGTGQNLARDLFFSGHVATIWLLQFSVPGRASKIVFNLLAILVSACVLLQHVHYSIDVFAAPFFAYVCYRIILFITVGDTREVL